MTTSRSNRTLVIACSLITSACFWGAASSHADAQPQRRHYASVEGYFIADYMGEYRLRVDGERRASGDLDLEPTYGGGVRFGWTSGMFTSGLMAEFRGYGNERYEDRDFAFDISPFLGLRVPLMDANGTKVRLRGTFPLGFTVLRPNEQEYGDARYRGFNAGALGGLEFVFGSFGLFTDVGLRYHRVYANEDLGLLGNVRASLSWVQLSVNAGVHLEF